MAMNAAIRRADGDIAALELVDPRYPMSHPSMRAVALRTSEGMLVPSESALRTSEGTLTATEDARVAGVGSASPERSRTVVKSFHPKAKRQGWPALIAVAAGLLLPLAFQTIRQRAAGVEPIVIPLPPASAVVVPPLSASAAPPAPLTPENAAPAPGVGRDAGASAKSALPRPIPRAPRPARKPATVPEKPAAVPETPSTLPDEYR